MCLNVFQCFLYVFKYFRVDLLVNAIGQFIWLRLKLNTERAPLARSPFFMGGGGLVSEEGMGGE